VRRLDAALDPLDCGDSFTAFFCFFTLLLPRFGFRSLPAIPCAGRPAGPERFSQSNRWAELPSVRIRVVVGGSRAAAVAGGGHCGGAGRSGPLVKSGQAANREKPGSSVGTRWLLGCAPSCQPKKLSRGMHVWSVRVVEQKRLPGVCEGGRREVPRCTQERESPSVGAQAPNERFSPTLVNAWRPCVLGQQSGQGTCPLISQKKRGAWVE
jgi:hypothetical protein